MLTKLRVYIFPQQEIENMNSRSRYETNFCLIFLGSIRFVPSKFVRPPIEFRKLYGPNIRQTVLENFFVVNRK